MRGSACWLLVCLAVVAWGGCASTTGQPALAGGPIQDTGELTPVFGDTSDTADDAKDAPDAKDVPDVPADTAADAQDTMDTETAGEVAGPDAEPDAPFELPDVDTTPTIGGTPMTVQEVRQLPATGGCSQDGTLSVLDGVLLTELVVASPAEQKSSVTALFAQAKGGGPWSGIQLVRMKKDGEDGLFAALKPGDVIHANGKVQTYYCMTQLTVAEWQATGATIKPVADVVAVDQVGDQAAPGVAEQWEGGRIAVENVVVSGVDVLGTDGKGHGEIWVGKDASDKALILAPGFYKTPFSTYDTATATWTVNVTVGKAWKSVDGVVAWSFGKSRLRPMGALGMVEGP